VATVQGNDWVPACSFEALGHRGYVTATTGEVLGQDENGNPMVVWNKHGKGEALHVAAFPALAWRKQAPLPDGYLMPQYSPELGGLITALARHANAQGPVRVSQYLVECGHLASEAGVAVPLLNWTQARVPVATIRIADARQPQSVESLVRGKVPFQRRQNALEVTMPISPGTDMLLIRW
jgi:hypothetical protein